jgi:hypothetical protein
VLLLTKKKKIKPEEIEEIAELKKSLVKRIYGRLSVLVAFQGHDTTQFP